MDDDYLRFSDTSFWFSDTSFWFGFGFAGLALAVYFLVIMPLFRFVWGFCFSLLRQLSKQAQYDHGGSDNEPLLGSGNGSIKDQSKSAEISAESNATSNDSPNQQGEIEPALPKHTSDDTASLPTFLGLEGLRQFTYQSLVDATQDFSLDCRVSLDRLGGVFRGKFFNTNEDIAIRRLKQYPVMSLKDFLDEVLLLSQANHPNLTKLIGYCAEKHNRLLVYEHVPRGTLENQLYSLYTCFDWDMRMEIALGVAKALEYLQNRMTPPIQHCYIVPSNVWLDEEYVPKLSAFGVVRMFPSPLEKFGSYDYALPDYMSAKKVTIEADIYGFGIFLLEILTGKKGIFLRKDGLPQNLSDWARPYLKDKQSFVEIVDRRLEGEVDDEKLQEVCDIIEKCLEKQPSSRLPVADIVARLSYLVT